MFRKLVSNLPFSPQVINQIAFYSKRLYKENATRRLVVVFAALALVVQFFTFIAPPEASTAASSNDMIYGGFRSGREVGDLLAYYDQGGDFAGHTNIRAIFDLWGITRNDLANTHIETIAGGPTAFGEWYSMGRNPHPGDVSTLNVAGGPIYLRPLGVWGAGAKHRALVGHRASDGWAFAVLVDCGNLALFNLPLPPPPPPPPQPKPAFSCTGLEILKLTNATGADAEGGTVEFRGNGSAHNTNIVSYLFDFGDGTTKTVPSSKTNVTVTHKYKESGTYTAKLRVKTKDGTTQDKPICQKTFTLRPVIPEKTVINLSRPKDDPASVDANNTTVKAGETLEYTLSLTNLSSNTAKDQQITENLNDILEYADLTEYDDATFDDGILSWPKADIKPKDTLSHSFKVRVKDPVPATPTSRSDPHSYDLCMDNVFEGQETRVCVNIPPPPKIVEQVAQELPNTGPGLNIVLGSIFVAIVTFFFLRNRQLIKEVTILRKEYNQT